MGGGLVLLLTQEDAHSYLRSRWPAPHTVVAPAFPARKVLSEAGISFESGREALRWSDRADLDWETRTVIAQIAEAMEAYACFRETPHVVTGMLWFSMHEFIVELLASMKRTARLLSHYSPKWVAASSRLNTPLDGDRPFYHRINFDNRLLLRLAQAEGIPVRNLPGRHSLLSALPLARFRKVAGAWRRRLTSQPTMPQPEWSETKADVIFFLESQHVGAHLTPVLESELLSGLRLCIVTEEESSDWIPSDTPARCGFLSLKPFLSTAARPFSGGFLPLLRLAEKAALSVAKNRSAIIPEIRLRLENELFGSWPMAWERYQLLKSLLSAIKPSLMVTPTMASMRGQMALLAAHDAGVQSLYVQHGGFFRETVSCAAPPRGPDFRALWGEEYATYIRGYIPEGFRYRIIGGPLQQIPSAPNDSARRRNPLAVVFTDNCGLESAYQELERFCLYEWLVPEMAAMTDVSFVLCPHPCEKPDYLDEICHAAKPGNIKLVRGVRGQELLAECDVAIWTGVTSMGLYAALASKRRLYIEYGALPGMNSKMQEPGAEIVRSREEFAPKLRSLLSLKEIPPLSKSLAGFAPAPGPPAVEALSRFILDLAGPQR